MNRTLSALILVTSATVARAEEPAFPLGVAAGDVTQDTAIVWTRCDIPRDILLIVAADPSLSQVVQTVTARATVDHDLTVKVAVAQLQPATTYYYAFRASDNGAVSDTGTFRTAPTPSARGHIRFVFSGDTNFAFAPFGVAAALAREDADAFIWFGDTIYADVPAGGLGVATTLDDYRAKYRQIRSDAGIRAALARMPIWVGADDHEVTNDYAGQDPALNTAQRDAAYQAFFEYMPIPDAGVADDPFRMYRTIRYGAGIVIFILDERQYREPSAKDVCGSNPDPDGFILGPLTQNSGCESELSAPRAMLGTVQLEWLKSGLLEAGDDAVKFVVNNVPLSYIGVYPYDRWDGYDAERRELLEFIHDNQIRNVIVLSTDIHASAYNPDISQYFRQHRPDYRLSSDIAIPEIITGPLGNATLHQSLTGLGSGVLGVLTGAAGQASPLLGGLEDLLIQRVRAANGLEMIQTNRVSYVMIEASDEGVSVAYRGATPEHAQDPNAPAETFFETSVSETPPPATAASCCLPIFVGGALSYWIHARRRRRTSRAHDAR